MNYTKLVTTDDVRTRIALRRAGQATKGTIAQRAAHNIRLNEEIMAANKVDIGYLKAMQAFADRVGEAQSLKLIDDKDSVYNGVAVSYEGGRVYDKIVIAFKNKDGSFTPTETLYFVKRSDGTIYGPKSPQAPNSRWYFGTIYTAQHWDWGGKVAEPKDLKKAGVKVTGTYGDYKHYAPVEDTEAEGLATAGV